MSKRKTGLGRFKRYEKPLVDERFDYAELVRRQIERCLISASDPEEVFSSAIQALEALIPEDLKDDVYNEGFELSNVMQEVLKYEKFGGRRMGRPDKPMTCYKNAYERYPVPYKTDEYGETGIDWDSPLIISPKLVTDYSINWHFRFKLAFNMFVRLGIAVRRLNRG